MPNSFKVEEIVLLNLNFSLQVPTEENDNEEIDIIPDESAKEESEPINFKCGSYYEEDERTLRVIVEVFIADKELSYVLDVAMGGAFKFEKAPDDKSLERLKHINCPAIIFPYLREVVSNITMKAGMEPLILRPMNFVRAYKDAKTGNNES